jgi:hypothetical protein
MPRNSTPVGVATPRTAPSAVCTTGAVDAGSPARLVAEEPTVSAFAAGTTDAQQAMRRAMAAITAPIA